MVTEYEAKSAYRGETALHFDEKRFSNLPGKLIDRLEKRAIRKSLNHAACTGLTLDLACGTGRITEFLLRRKCTVVGADISADMIKLASHKLKNQHNLLGLVVCDAEKLPFQNNSFDNVVAFRLMGHIPVLNRLKILNETKYVAKNWLVLSYSNSYSAMSIFKNVRSKFTRKPIVKWHYTKVSKVKDEVTTVGLYMPYVEYVLRYIAETYVAVIKIKSETTHSNRYLTNSCT